METKQEMFFLHNPDRNVKVAYLFFPQTEEMVLVGKFDGRTCKVDWQEMSRMDARREYSKLRREGYDSKSDDEVLVFPFYGSFSVNGAGVGKLDEVNEWRDNYLNSFHPAGYGTRVSVKPLDHGLASLTFTRYKSCD